MLLAQLPQKVQLASKVVKINSQRSKSVKLTVPVCKMSERKRIIAKNHPIIKVATAFSILRLSVNDVTHIITWTFSTKCKFICILQTNSNFCVIYWRTRTQLTQLMKDESFLRNQEWLFISVQISHRRVLKADQCSTKIY